MTLSPHLIDAILALIGIEVLVLSAWLVRARASRLVPALICFLVSGALLMLALRLSLSSPDHGLLILVCITLSLPAHIGALVLVWRALKPGA